MLKEPSFSVLLDTSFLIRLLSKNDPLHHHIEKIISENRFEDLRGMLKNGACYCLEEV